MINIMAIFSWFCVSVIVFSKAGDKMSPKTNDVKIEVVAYSGYKANERPVYFLLEDRKKEIIEISNRWIGPDHDYFRVIADDGLQYQLKWDRSLGIWFLEK